MKETRIRDLITDGGGIGKPKGSVKKIFTSVHFRTIQRKKFFTKFSALITKILNDVTQIFQRAWTKSKNKMHRYNSYETRTTKWKSVFWKWLINLYWFINHYDPKDSNQRIENNKTFFHVFVYYDFTLLQYWFILVFNKPLSEGSYINLTWRRHLSSAT